MHKQGVTPLHSGIPLSLKKNDVTPFAAASMDLEVITRGKGSQRKMNIIYYLMWNIKKKDTDERIYKTEGDSQTKKTKVWFPKRKGGEN